MATYTTQRIVRAPPSEVFGRWKDIIPELPKLFPDWLAEMRVVREDGNERTIRCTEIWAGKKYTYTARQQLTPPSRAEGVVTEGEGRGSTEVWTFDPVPEGTRMAMTFRSKGAMTLMLVLFRKRFAQEFEGRLDRWAKAVEGRAA